MKKTPFSFPDTQEVTLPEGSVCRAERVCRNLRGRMLLPCKTALLQEKRQPSRQRRIYYDIFQRIVQSALFARNVL